jgi:hypothetical protein
VVDNINQIGTHNYQCIVTALGSGCNPKTSDIATVEVNPSPYFSQHPVNPPAICTSGSTVFFAEAFTGSLSASYKWQYNNGGIWQDVVDNIPSGATYAGADTNILYVSNIIANGDFEYRCIFFTNSLTCSSDTSLSARISVAPQPSFLTVSPGPQEICVGGSAGLNVTTAGGTDNTYQWQIFNNGFWSNIVNNTPAGVLYSGLNTDSLIFIGANADSGEYTFQCILISYGNGCVQSVSNPMTVIVHEDPAILPNTIPVESYACMNGTFDLTLQGNSPNLIYTWEYLSGTWDTVENNIPLNVTYTGQGTNVLSVQYNSNSLAFLNYRARVTRPLSGCNTQITGAFNILLSEQPYIASSGVPAYAAICDGGVEDFFVTVNGGISGGLSYQWDYADNPGFSNAIVAPGSGNSNTYGAIAAGYYRCTITSTAGSGCNTLTTDAGELAVRPDPQIELVATDTVLCSGETFEFTRQVYGGAGSAVFTLDSARQSNMIWGSVAVTDSVFEKIFSVSDTYFYRIIFNSLGSGCDVDTSNIIQLVSLPNPEAPIVSYNAAGICTGTQNADFVITNPQPSLNYNWHISPAETIHLNQSMTQAEISFLSAGAHTLEVTSSLNNGQCTTSSINNFSLSGNAPTGVDIVLTQPGNNLFCLNDNYYSYQWGFDYKTSGTRTIIPGVSSPIYTAGNTLDTINKAYWLKVCTSDGCCTRVYFNTKPFITGIGSSITNLFNVYPNPSNGILLLENTLSFPLSVEISSMDGKLVKRVDEFEQQTMVNINELADGIYLIAAYNKAGQRDLKKIVLLK